MARGLFGLALMATCLVSARATTFPEGIRWRLEAQPWWSVESNPFRFSEANRTSGQSDMILGTLVRGAAEIPLLSERTRLELSGTVGEARYQRYRQLDHRPTRGDAVFRWHAGDLLSGTISHRYGKRLYQYLNKSYPDRDQVSTHLTGADLNLHVTPSLSLPRIAVQRLDTGYDYWETSMLFTRRIDQFEVGARYAGIGRSSIHGGVRIEDGHYRERTPEWIAQVGSRYRDQTLFLDTTWDYSVKTILTANLAYLRRQYDDVAGRDFSDWYALLNAGWQPSVKTRFDLSLWRRPFPNDEDPAILYGTLTGGGLTVRWHPTVKTMFSFAVDYEHQRNTPVPGATASDSRLLRFGPRFEWNFHRSIQLFVDGWHDRNTGGTAGSSYRNTTVRIGLVIKLDNNWKPPYGRMWHSECDPPRYIEAFVCVPD